MTSSVAAEPKPKLIRAMGRWTLTALVINSIIASGIFGLPDDLARFLGPSAPWAYLLGALGTGMIIIVFAELASQFQDAGGPYVYARSAFGPFAGIQTAWFAWLARVASAAAIANVFVSYLGEFWKGITAPMPRAILLTALFSVIALINVRGIRQGAGLNNLFTAAKLIPLVLFSAVGVFLVTRITPSPAVAPPTLGTWLDALAALLFAYGGFESAVLPASEAKTPRRDAPFALLVGFATVAAIYVSIHIVSMWALSNLAQSERPLADAARVFAGPAGAAAISLGAVLSTVGGLCAGAVTAPRLVYALAERGDFPRIFSAVHPRFATPYISILVWAALALGLAISGQFIWLAMLSVAARLVTYGMSCAALIQLRRTQPQADAWRAPAGRVVALIGAAFCALLVLRMDRAQVMITAGVAVVATINWMMLRRAGPRTAIVHD